jgi:hypothetical protein
MQSKNDFRFATPSRLAQRLNRFSTFCVFASLTLGTLSLQGCLTVGDDFTSEVTWIQANKTTRKEIEAKVGEPFRVGYDTGLLTFTYGFYRYSVFRPTRTKDLTVRFNKDGTVNSYSFASSFDEDKNTIAK